MSTRFTLLSLAIGCASLFASCNHQNKHKCEGITPPPAVEKTFSQSYPNAAKTEFEKSGDYYVAEFKNDAISAKAWFSAEGTLLMEKAEMAFNKLPTAVITSFQEGEYGRKVEDTDVIILQNGKIVYKIEVEGNNKDIDLYYSADGVLIKALAEHESNDATLISSDLFKDPLVN